MSNNVRWCGVVWCGLVWWGVVWCGWYGVVWCGEIGGGVVYVWCDTTCIASALCQRSACPLEGQHNFVEVFIVAHPNIKEIFLAGLVIRSE